MFIQMSLIYYGIGGIVRSHTRKEQINRSFVRQIHRTEYSNSVLELENNEKGGAKR